MNAHQLIQNGLRPQQPQLQIAAPLNDIQLIALIAAHLYQPNALIDRDATVDAVSTAVEIVREAVAQGTQLARPAVKE